MIKIHHGYKKKLIVASILSTTLTFLTGCDKEGDAKEHLQKGVEYLNKGDYEKARLELKTSSQSDKDTADTYYYLALLDEKNRNYKAMKENLTKTLELAPTRTEVRLRLARVLLLLGEVDAADEQTKIILKDSSQNLDAQALKATVLIRQKKQPEALAIIDHILKENPNHADALALKALVFLEKNDINTALSLIEAAIKSDPKNIAMHLFKIQLHAKQKDANAVIADYQKLIALYPDDQEFKIMLVKEYAKNGKDKETEELLRAVITQFPNDLRPKLLLLDYLGSTNNEKALQQFHQFTEQYKDKPRVLLEFADWMVRRHNFDEANTVLNRVMELEKGSNVGFVAKTRLAKNAFDNKDFDRADKFITEILEANSNFDDAKIVRARLLLEKKQYDEAIELLNKINWSKPNSDEVQLLLGQTFLNKGDKEEAYKYFLKALEINPANLDALVYVYQKALAANDLQYAKEVLEKALRFVPENMVLLQQLAKIYLSNQDWHGAKMVADAMANVANPLAADLANHLQAQILQGQGEFAKALILYKELLDKYPENRDALAGLAACYEGLHKRAEMINILNDLLAKNPKNTSAATLLASLYIMDKKYDKGSAVLAGLIKDSPNNTQAYALLANAKLAQNDTKGAIDVFREALKQNPNDIKLSLSLASLYERQNDYDSAMLVYQALVDKYPDLDVAVNNLASLLSEHYDSKDKLDKAVQLSKKFKDSTQPYFKDTYAWALIRQGSIKDGIDMLTQLAVDAPDVAIFKYHLGAAHYRNGDTASAISELKQAVQLAKQKDLVTEQKISEKLLKEIADQNPSH